MPRITPGRREFLAAAGAAATGAGAVPGPPRDQPREPPPPDANAGSLFPLIEAIARPRPFTLAFRGSGAAAFRAHRDRARNALLETLGPPPDPVDPKPEVVDRVDAGDFIREKILFSTTPAFRVPAYLHLPKGGSRPAPAIVDLHSHGGMFLFGKEKVIDFGQNHPAMTEYHKVNYQGRPTATALARRGYVVITIDAFPFGERRLMLAEDASSGWERANYSLEDVRRLNAKCRSKESTLVKSLAYAGMNWPGITAWDDIRTVDYLCTRPEVDRTRLGCVGVSFGGWRSLFLSALDDRIAAACIAGFMSTVRPMIRRHMDTHSFVHFVPGLHALLDLPDVAALRAPKPLLVLQCRKDGLFPPAGMEESVERIAAIYSAAGAAASFASRFYDQPHIFNLPMQDDAFAWFDRVLKR